MTYLWGKPPELFLTVLNNFKISFKFPSYCQNFLQISFRIAVPSNFLHFVIISFQKEISFKVEALVVILINNHRNYSHITRIRTTLLIVSVKNAPLRSNACAITNVVCCVGSVEIQIEI